MSARNFALERYGNGGQSSAMSRTDDPSMYSRSYYTGDSASRSYYSRDSRSYRTGDSRSYRTGDSRSYRTGDSRSYRTGDSRSVYSSSTRGSRSFYSRDSRASTYSGSARSAYSDYSRVHPSKPQTPPVKSGGNNVNVARNANEFDSLSEAEKLSSILQRSDVERHKHNLAYEYYRFRKYCLFIPTLIIILFITVVGFTVDTDVIKDHMKVGDSSTREFLVLLVASMGFLAMVLTLLSNAIDYNTKINMHKGAAIDLESLCDRIKLYRVERTMDQEAMEEEEERLTDNYRRTGSDGETIVSSTSVLEDGVDLESQAANFPPALDNNGALVVVPEGQQLALVNNNNLANAIAMQKQIINKSKQEQRKIDKKNQALAKTLIAQKVAQAKRDRENIKNVVEFYGYSVTLQQISVGCKSDIPIRISKFFDVMETRVELMSLSRTLGVAQDENVNAADESSGRMRKNQIIRLCANEIYNEINGYWAWPLFAPNVDRAIERSLRRVGQLLNMNYRARKRCKLFPCCAIPLCCKKKSSSNVFAIINEGIDSRELDMMQVERMELMRMETERKANRMAVNPEEVLEMKSLLSGSVAGESRKPQKQPRGVKGGSRVSRDQMSRGDRTRDDMSMPSVDPAGRTLAGLIAEGTASKNSRPGSRQSRARDPGGFQVRSVSSHHADEEDSRLQHGFDDDISQLEDEEGSWIYDQAEKKKKKKKVSLHDF